MLSRKKNNFVVTNMLVHMHKYMYIFNPNNCFITYLYGGRTGLMVRASDFGSGDPGSILGQVGVFVSLSKRHLLPKKYW